MSFSASTEPIDWYCICTEGLTWLKSCPHLVKRGKVTDPPAPAIDTDSCAIAGNLKKSTRPRTSQRPIVRARPEMSAARVTLLPVCIGGTLLLKGFSCLPARACVTALRQHRLCRV